MKALRLHAGVLALAETPAPIPAPGEALLRPTRMAIAAADRACTDPSIIRGHEFAATVESVGEPATPTHAAWLGKRVVGSINLVCGQCPLCRGGLSNHCRSRRVLGLCGKDGCFAECFTLPIANLVELPASIDDEQAVFAGTLASVIHASQMIRFEGKPYVTVLGDGPAGLLAAQVLSRLNASVRLLGKHPEKLALCERWGIKHRHISEVGKRADQDVVVDCTGHASGLELAAALVRPRGKIILKGSPVPQTTEPASAAAMAAVVCNEIEVIGARCGRLADGVAMLARGTVDTRPLVTSRLRLADIPGALTAPHSGIKTIIVP